jgi:hypothetical protein
MKGVGAVALRELQQAMRYVSVDDDVNDEAFSPGVYRHCAPGANLATVVFRRRYGSEQQFLNQDEVRRARDVERVLLQNILCTVHCAPTPHVDTVEMKESIPSISATRR